MAYHQNDSNTCCFGSLAYKFTVLGEANAAREIAMQIEGKLHCQSQGYNDRIAFSDAIVLPATY